MAEMRESNSLKVKIDVDCADALKGLKAITREAKKALAALKRLEEQQRKIEYVIPLNIKDASLHNPNAKDFLNKIIKDMDIKRVGI